jgi:hypothetical protein
VAGDTSDGKDRERSRGQESSNRVRRDATHEEDGVGGAVGSVETVARAGCTTCSNRKDVRQRRMYKKCAAHSFAEGRRQPRVQLVAQTAPSWVGPRLKRRQGTRLPSIAGGSAAFPEETAASWRALPAVTAGRWANVRRHLHASSCCITSSIDACPFTIATHATSAMRKE